MKRRIRLAAACLALGWLAAACGVPHGKSAPGLSGSTRPVGSRTPPSTSTSPSPSLSPSPSPPRVPVRDAVVALQVSHQDDAGPPGWHEWAIAGDVSLRVLDRLRFAPTVLAWDLAGPLTGSNRYAPTPTNTPSFDSELAFASQSDPDLFLAMHTDNGQPSGVSAVVMPGDERSRELAERLLVAMSDATGLTNRGVEEIRMYSLERVRNPATYRVMLRLGDNESDSQYLWDPCHREAEAGAITGALGAFLAEHYPLTTKRRATRALQPEAFAGEDPRLVLSQDDHGPTPHRFWHTYPEAPESPFHVTPCGAA